MQDDEIALCGIICDVIQKNLTKVVAMKPNIDLQDEKKLDIIEFLIPVSPNE